MTDVPTGWGTESATVAALLGPTVAFEADPLVDLYVDAANEWCWRKRREAGYVDDSAATATADVVMGCTLYAAALYRERQSVDGYQTFEDFPTAALTGGSLGQIRRMLGIGKARTDGSGGEPGAATARLVARRRRRAGWLW
jgi:hypothetical protein